MTRPDLRGERGGGRGSRSGVPAPAPHPATRHQAAIERSSAPTPSRWGAAQPPVARRDPARPPRHAARRARSGGRFRRFVRRHGWRAYAVPVLTLATIVALVDLVARNSAGDAARTDPVAAVASTSADPSAEVVPAPSPPVEPASPEPAPTGPAVGEGVPSDAPAPPSSPAYVEQGTGTVSVVDGVSGVYGTGPLQRFVVEVEDGIGVDGAGFAAAVEATLGDPRSWGNGGRLSMQRVGAAEAAAGEYDFRVSLVSPGSMERYCPGVGTGGYTSCRYGERAVVNLARWETAVPDYGGDIATYRQYVVNHEVGHALGNGHQPCPGPGQVAPVMYQQTLGLDGCTKNAWPFP